LAELAQGQGGELAKRELLVHTSVSETGIVLYGFLLAAERAMFRRLLKVSRLGPALGQKILDGATVAELEAMIAGGDVARLQEIKGVGPKLAGMIVVQLGETKEGDTRQIPKRRDGA